MGLYPKPGFPRHINGNAGTTMTEWPLRGRTTWLIIQNTSGSEAIEAFFTLEAKEKGAGFGLTIPSGMGFEAPMRLDRFWLLAGAAGVSFEVLAIVAP